MKIMQILYIEYYLRKINKNLPKIVIRYSSRNIALFFFSTKIKKTTVTKYKH